MSEPPTWTQRYIGIPFLDGGRICGLDCYGLGRHVMREELGVMLPEYAVYEDASDLEVVGPMIDVALADADSPWREVLWEQRQAYDWVVYRRGEVPAHLSIVADRDWALHTFRDAGSGCEQFDRAIHRLKHTALGCYRHQEAA